MLLLDIIRHKKAEKMGAKARLAYEAFIKYQEILRQEDKENKTVTIHSDISDFH